VARAAAKCSTAAITWIASPREGGEASTSKGGRKDGEGSAISATNALLSVAAAASGLALLITGYYYWINSESDDEESATADLGAAIEDEESAKVREQANSEAAISQARDALRVEWEQAVELNKVSDGKLGFEAWWSAADPNSKKALLQSARDLMRQRLLEHQPDAATALDLLCPEIGDTKLERLVRGNSLVALIRLRISQIDAVRKHDISFVRENLAKQNLQEQEGIQGQVGGAIEVLCDNRQLLMMTFLCDVLILCRHMGNFPTMLQPQNASAAIPAITT